VLPDIIIERDLPGATGEFRSWCRGRWRIKIGAKVVSDGCRVGRGGVFALPPPARSNGSCSFPASRFPMWVALIGEGWVVFQERGRSAARGRSLL
jgi:hypothetical protein